MKPMRIAYETTSKPEQKLQLGDVFQSVGWADGEVQHYLIVENESGSYDILSLDTLTLGGYVCETLADLQAHVLGCNDLVYTIDDYKLMIGVK